MNANPACPERRHVRFAAFGVLLYLCGCDGGEKEVRFLPDPDPAGSFSPASRTYSAQRVARLERKAMAETLEVPLRIEADERRSLQVAAPAAGRIEAVAIKTLDAAVKAGDLIATLYSPELVAAQREFLLLDPRKEGGLARKAEERLRRMGLSAGQILSLRSRGKPLEQVPITSPREGYVIPETQVSTTGGSGTPSPQGAMGSMGGGMGGGTGQDQTGGPPGGTVPMGAGPEASLRAGAYVERGSRLATLNDLAVVAAVLSLPASAAGLFRLGDSVHLEMREAGFMGMATLDFLAAEVADSSGNIIAMAYLENRGGRLKPGLLGKAHLAPAAESAWVLPRGAVQDMGDRHIVWMRTAGDSGAFEAREVRVGRQGARNVEIVEGLPHGAAVAAQASLMLDPDVMSEPLGLPTAGTTGSGVADGEGPPSEAIASRRPEPDEGREAHAGREGDGEHAGHEAQVANEGHAGHDGHESTGEAGSTAAKGDQENPVEKPMQLTEEKARLAGIRTAKAEVSPLVATRTFRAVIQLNGPSRITLPSRAEGRIVQVAVLRPGEKVARGQMLATLESETVLIAEDEFLSVQRKAADLSTDVLRSQAQATRRRLETLGMSAERIQALAARGKAFPTISILSPADGILLEALVRPGQYVAAGSALFAIGHADKVWVETWLLPDEVEAYPQGTEASVRVEGLLGDPVRGRLEHIRREATASGTVTLAHVGLANPEGRILPGMQAWVTFRQPARTALSVPTAALLRSSRMTEVWVETGPWAYAPRMVRTGLEAGDRVEILTGVSPGEKVVASGGYLLQSEWTLRQGAGMGHGHGGH